MVTESLGGYKGNQRGAKKVTVPVWLYDNSWWIGALLVFISIQANAAGDAMKFYTADPMKRDKLWHVLKYTCDRPALFLGGVFSFLVIEEIFFTQDIWHLPVKFWAWSFGIVISLFSFKFALRMWEKHFKNEKD